VDGSTTSTLFSVRKIVNSSTAPQPCDVLVVEDSFDDAFFLKRAWEKNGEPYQLVHVTDGEKGREFLSAEGEFSHRTEQTPPKLIVCDLKMPRWDGMQLLRWVRAHPTLSTVPFVMLSSSPYSNDIEAAYAAGANAYFVKPRTPPGFVQLLLELQHFWRPQPATP
jgi:CheY-like chemotaxis protein